MLPVVFLVSSWVVPETQLVNRLILYLLLAIAVAVLRCLCNAA